MRHTKTASLSLRRQALFSFTLWLVLALLFVLGSQSTYGQDNDTATVYDRSKGETQINIP